MRDILLGIIAGAVIGMALNVNDIATRLEGIEKMLEIKVQP